VVEHETHEVRQAEKRPGEGIFLAVLLLGLARLLPEALKLPGIFQGQWAGPGSVAQLLLLALMALAGGLLVAAIRVGSQSLTLTARYLFSRDAVLLLACVIGYTVALVPLGFELATLGFLVAAMYLLEPVRMLRKVALAVATVGIIYVIFAMLFEVVLP
jgi:uncharacterized membrane protein